jgi:Arc/MetJ-type ribon-helix-helix transcriptional regulator
MNKRLETVYLKTYKIPDSYEKLFDRKIKPLGQFLNYPDFVRDAVREKLERDLK